MAAWEKSLRQIRHVCSADSLPFVKSLLSLAAVPHPHCSQAAYEPL